MNTSFSCQSSMGATDMRQGLKVLGVAGAWGVDMVMVRQARAKGKPQKWSRRHCAYIGSKLQAQGFVTTLY